MAKKILDGATLHVFFEGIATMLDAGIRTEEAVGLLAQNSSGEGFGACCKQISRDLTLGEPLSKCMQQTESFPEEAVSMVRTGELTGRLESTCVALARRYGQEDRLYAKLDAAVRYPAAFFAVLSVVLLVVVMAIIPVFADAYYNIAGDISTGSFAYVGAALTIGWVALIVSLLISATLFAVSIWARTGDGRAHMDSLLSKMGFTKRIAAHLSLERFATSMAAYLSIGFSASKAMEQSLDDVRFAPLKQRLQAALDQMNDKTAPKSFAQAVSDNDILGPVYARMIVVGSRTGRLEGALDELSSLLFDDAVESIDDLLDAFEPMMGLFLTIAIGAALVSVMLPLVGIMSAIG